MTPRLAEALRRRLSPLHGLLTLTLKEKDLRGSAQNRACRALSNASEKAEKCPAWLSHQGFQPRRLFAGLEWQNGVMIIAVLIVQECAAFDDVQVPAVFS